jgi:hypothetical protein
VSTLVAPDVAAAADVVARLGALMRARPEIVEVRGMRTFCTVAARIERRRASLAATD